MSASPRKRTSQARDPDSDDECVDTVKRERIEREREAREREEYMDQDDEGDGEHRDPSDDEDDSCDDVEANIQALRKQRLLERKRRPADELATAGVVKDITLINFMCHDNLTVEFGEKMNFVVGHNGSGKSAVLTGLAVALGAKATITGRGAGLKSMIQSGKEKAKVILTMRNVGDDAFEHEKFGDEIVIERSIDKSGASGFKFRGRKDGPIVSDKRETLTKMCAHWQINIDSPLCMLTQDNAKTFLARTDPKVMYSFFLRGSGLASIMEEYQQTNLIREKLSRDLESAEEALPEQRSKVKKLEHQIQLAEKARGLRKKQEDLKAQLAWAFVHDKEIEVEKMRKFTSDLIKKADMAEKQISEVDREEEEAQEKIAALTVEITEFIEGHKETQQQITHYKKKKQDAQQAMAAAESSIRDCKKEIRDREEEIREFEELLATARREQEGEVNPEQVELQKKLDRAEQTLHGLKRTLPQSERAVADAKVAFERARKLADEAGLAAEEAGRASGEIRNRLDNLRRNTTDRLAQYGRSVDKVLEAINRAQWKHSRPIGPLGLHIKLKDREYRTCITNVLGGQLCAFAVRDQADQDQLVAIFDDCFAKYGFQASPVPRQGQKNHPAIIKHSGDLFDYSRGDLHLRGLGETVLSKLEFDSEEVLRILINSHQIEANLVAKTNRDALDLINSVLSPQLPKARVATAGGFNHTGTYGNNLRTSGPQNSWRGPDMFVTDVKAEIEKLRPVLAEREQEYRAKKAEHDNRKNDAAQARRAVDEAEQALKRNLDGIPHVERGIQSINNKLMELRPVDGNATEISLQEIRQERNKLNEELSLLEGSLENKKKDFERAETDYDNAMESVRTFRELLQAKKDALMADQAVVSKAKKTRDHYRGSLNRTRAQITQSEDDLKAAEKTLASWTTSAMRFMDRPDEFGEAAKLEAQRKVVDRQIQEAQRTTNIDLDAITQQFLTESERLTKTADLIEKFREIEKTLKEGFDNRTEKWQKLRQTISMRIHMRFIENIRKRGFDGHIEFDHNIGEELKLEVATSSDVSATQRELVYKKPESLSGGERSFVTVSLLLAMWDAAPANLRCLDEWDVFLDAANRKIAANLLVEGSKDTTSKQFVLISPLDMNGVNTDAPGYKVIRLLDPVRRDQRRLDEFRQ